MRRGLPQFPWLSVVLLAGAVVLCVAPSSAGAQGFSAEENGALKELRQGKLVTARTAAEKILKTKPNSIVGQYVLGTALFEAEGSLAKAMFHLGKAREAYETRWSASSQSPDSPWELHRDVLFAVQNVAGQMELSEYQLDVLGYHDFLYDPDLLAERAWPLMHLGRYKEAREFARKAIVSKDPAQRSLGMNALCAVEGEAGTRQPYFDACLAAYQNAATRRAQGEDAPVTVHAYNAATAALAVGRPDEAERLALAGANQLEFTTANPWRLLLRLYVDEARLTDAVEALREMQRWRKRQPAYLRDQDRAETDVAFATLLLLSGDTQRGWSAMDRAMAQPDRRGLSSSNAEQALGAHALLRRALATTQTEREVEGASARGLLAGLLERVVAVGQRVAVYPDDERVRSALSDEKRLVATLRLYVRGGIEPLPVWLVGDLVQVMGPGVISVALQRARKSEGPGSPVQTYYDALEAEVLLARGDEDRALAMAERAAAALPKTEVLLRARVLAVGAEAARRLGKFTKEASLLEQVLRVDGGVLRRMRLSIPAQFKPEGSALSRDASAAIKRSPRFRDDPGFVVRVTEVAPPGGGNKDGLRACLLTGRNERIACAEVHRDETKAGTVSESQKTAGKAAAPAKQDRETDDALTARLSAAFHHRVFAAEVALSSIDTNSLDGRVSTGSEAAREEMEKTLEGLSKEP